MTTITEVTISKHSGVTERLAEKYGTDKARLFNVIKATCKMEKATQEQFEAFLLVAERYNLNPLLKQLWAYPDRNGGIMHMVSLDGWISIVNSQPQFDGYETSIQLDDKGYPISATCTMWRKDRSRPTTKTIYINEWKKDTSPVWKQMPCHFIEMRAYIQCARMCFNISGINDDEIEPEINNLSEKYPEAINTNSPQPEKFNPEISEIDPIEEELTIPQEIRDEISEFENMAFV